MIDRLVVYALFLVLASVTFLESFVGWGPANSITVVVLAVAGYRLFIRLCLFPDYRESARQLMGRARSHRGHYRVFVAYVLLVFYEILRSWQLGTLNTNGLIFDLVRWTSVLAILITVAIDGIRRQESAPVLSSVAVALMAYSGLNVILFTLGVENNVLGSWFTDAPEPSVMFRLLGLDMNRASLPIGFNPAATGPQIASGIVFGILLARARLAWPSRQFGIALAALSGICVLITDTRGAMLGAVVGTAIGLAPLAIKRRSRWIAIAGPIAPILLLLLLNSEWVRPWLQLLDRQGEGTVGALSGRPMIWGAILTFLSSTEVTHLFGFGAFGQVGSGVSTSYAMFFPNLADATRASAHNAFLQSILDVGYIGTFVVLLLLWKMLSHLGRASGKKGILQTWDTIALATVTCLITIGMTDDSWSLARPLNVALFLALNLHCLTARPTEAQPQPTIRRRGVVPVETSGGSATFRDHAA